MLKLMQQQQQGWSTSRQPLVLTTTHQRVAQ
jgi:hypothetical protein